MLAQSLIRRLSVGVAAWRGFSTAAASTVPSGSVVRVQDDAEFCRQLKEVAGTEAVCVVDFSADWCGPCNMIAPIYESYSQRYKGVKFLKVDIDSSTVQRTITDHEITGVPAFFFYKGAKRVDGFTGARPDLLLQMLKKHAEAA